MATFDGYTDQEPTRLVKLQLPVPLLRAMDGLILASGGRYFDREEFIAEAILDRLAEEGAAPAPAAPPVTVPAQELEETFRIGGTWSATAQAPARVQAGHNFGLHNRDLPTLWAVGNLVKHSGKPVDWATFTSQLRPTAQAVGAWLRKIDAAEAPPVKASTGFPRGGSKSKSSEDRFLATALGQIRAGEMQGPAFLMSLLAHEPTTEGSVTATDAAVILLQDLATAGLSFRLPQPVETTRTWLGHLHKFAPDEHKAWLEVLTAVAKEPTRAELVAEFPQWSGSVADTNCMGYISRSREWGLIEAQLHDNRYRLTDLGHEMINQGGIP